MGVNRKCGMQRKLWMLPLLMLSVGSVAAQDLAAACPAIVEAALDSTAGFCAELGRNEACYGNINIAAEPRAGAGAFTFESPGDLVSIADVETMTLSGMSEAGAQWGVALLQVQANIPNTVPGQNVTVLLFGDVEVTNAGTAPLDIEPLQAAAIQGVNVRVAPSLNAEVVREVEAGTILVVNGRNTQGDWLRVALEDQVEAWVYAPLMQVEGDLATLPMVEGVFRPMQAFYFRSGVGDAPCAAAPHSGVMIQTPEGIGQVEMVVNDATVRLGSTAYLLMVPARDDPTAVDMGVSIIEGYGEVTAQGVTQPIFPGTWVRVPMEMDQLVSNAPLPPKPYRENEMFVLPTNLLPREVEVPPPMAQEEIDRLLAGG